MGRAYIYSEISSSVLTRQVQLVASRVGLLSVDAKFTTPPYQHYKDCATYSVKPHLKKTQAEGDMHADPCAVSQTPRGLRLVSPSPVHL